MLELGKRIVNELGLDPSVDTLGRWMAHYIAELIQGVKMAGAEERPAKLAVCADAILDLWKHRRELPSGKRPFENVESILRALESLDPTDDTPRYFPGARLAADEAKQDAKTKKWLQLANDLDYSAKILIGYCLTQAAQAAIDKLKEWVALAEAAGINEGVEFRVIRFIANQSDLLKTTELDDDADRKLLEDRIKRLEQVKKMVANLTSDLRRQLRKSKSHP